MDTNQVNIALSEVDFFVGTFALDQLPDTKRRPAAFIANTEPASKPGEHWVALILKEDQSGEYFDSFGLPPLLPPLHFYLSKHCPEGYIYNSQTMQHPSSISCGLYCIQFVKARSIGITYSDYISLFTKNLNENENIVNEIF